ncbi:alpha-hydroxy acid oxidase [Kribbella deserti]|uniref:Alpha-hydroxy acid oxidase n=1 Tax=Kribbella deserti TaxID=1926257 RepID=A0ABV6QVY4_9ACTN
MTEAVCLADYESLAAEVLPAEVFDFVAGGSGAETTLRRNRTALDAVSVIPKVLAGVAEADPSTTLLGQSVAFPVAVAPMAYQQLVHPDGELGLAKAASGIPYVISMLSSHPLEEIAAAADIAWFQLYWLRDRGVVESLIDRAVAAGCSALMVTVDVPVMGRRLRDVRNSFVLPTGVIAANLVEGSTGRAHQAAGAVSAVAAHTASVFNPALGWDDLEWLAGRSSLPLVVKGILDPEDARRAVAIGAAGVVVSNHGGRQLDGSVASINALPAVVDAIGNDCQVLLDSGVRGATDILRALASGAAGVLLGRPLLWALAVDDAGTALVRLRDDLIDVLLLAGCADVAAAARLATSRES